MSVFLGFFVFLRILFFTNPVSIRTICHKVVRLVTICSSLFYLFLAIYVEDSEDLTAEECADPLHRLVMGWFVWLVGFLTSSSNN